MRQTRFVHTLASVLQLVASTVAGAQHRGTRADYARAEQFIGANAQELVIDDAVQPHWLPTDRFWFRNRTERGYEFDVVDAATGARRPAFDHARLAAAVSLASDTAVDPLKLPFRDIRFVNGERALRFSMAKGKTWQCDLTTYACVGPDTAPLERINEVASPDRKWIAFTRNDNLWVREVATGRETQLTNDADSDFGYAKPTGCCQQVTVIVQKRDQRPVLVWSPDSRRIATYKSGKYTVERPLHLGAALAGRAAELSGPLSAVGLPMGEAFQLRDDVLGAFGESSVTGKPVGDDLREGKLTPLVAAATERFLVTASENRAPARRQAVVRTPVP